MESLNFFLRWGGILFLLRRHFGHAEHVSGDGQAPRGGPLPGSDRSPKQFGWTAPKTAVDTVCGTTVQTNATRSSVDDGAVRCFCSHKCRELEVASRLLLEMPPDTAPAQSSQNAA